MQGVVRSKMAVPFGGEVVLEFQGFPTTFHIVLKPTETSELADICFETDILGFARQIKGGLNEGQIHGLYVNGSYARRVAAELLKDKG